MPTGHTGDVTREGAGGRRRLLETTLIRVGNDEYARPLIWPDAEEPAATVTGRGSASASAASRVGSTRSVSGIELATVVRRCRTSGQELFQYGDDGEPHDVASEDVNDYLREISGSDITAGLPDVAGTVSPIEALRALAPGTDDRSSRKNVVEAVRLTSDRLGNTPAVARRSMSTRRSSRHTWTARSAGPC
jgi:DNA topoisomerase-1